MTSAETTVGPVDVPLPYDLAAEQALVGSLLLDRETIVRVAPVVHADDFYAEELSQIFQVCLDLYGQGTPPDPITVFAMLQDRCGWGKDRRIELYDLVNRTPTASHAFYYAERVHRLAQHRKLIDAGGRIAGSAYSVTDEAPWQIAQDILESVRDDVQGVFEPLSSIALDAATRLHQSGHRGVPTGFAMLDDLLGGMQPTDLLLMASRPGVGKTAFAARVARNASSRGYKGGFFSLEMPSQQLANRWIAAEAGVNLHALRLGELSAEEWERIDDAAQRVSQLPVFIDDTPGLRVQELAARARRLKYEEDIDYLIIDYLQLLRGSERKFPNRVEEVSEISRELKLLARKLKIPVLALAQLSRNVEHRHSHDPQLSDLKESGSLEQDADVVIFLHREELYDPDSTKRGLVEVRVAKHRNGPLAWVPLRFAPETTSYVDLTYRPV